MPEPQKPQFLYSSAKPFSVGSVGFSEDSVVLIAGPCSVESAAQMDAVAESLKSHGLSLMRGGIFKPRTSPYSFQGLGYEGMEIMRDACRKHGLLSVSEVMDTRDVARMSGAIDVLQIGARNMQNFALLREVGRSGNPVLLKRGMSATIEELLMSAEYLLKEGNSKVMLCERGIRTFERETRNTLDISVVPVLKAKTALPVIVDPSHAAGRRDLVLPLSRAAIAAGASGIMVEAHPDPMHALSDREQQLSLEEFGALVRELRGFCAKLGKRLV